MSESMVQMQRKLADVTAKLEKVEEELAEAQATLAKLREQIKVEWLPVVGFEGLYEVSSNGDIRNVRTGNIAAKSLMGDGYVKANLWKKGKRKQTSAHRVVAEAFIGGIDGLEINHRNGVKTDNRVSNLEITTRSGNVNHSYYELGHIIKPILATSIATGDTTEYRSIEEAVRLGGFRSSSIYDCLNGKVKTHSGHSFSRPAAPVPEQREGNLAVAAPTTSDDQFREAMKKLHAVLLQSAPQSGSEPQKEYAWECNECGAQEYTMSVGQSIIESGALACGSCGCDEFHKAEVRND